jgi:hypothetical protein
MFADGGLAAEHDGIGLLEDGVGHVGDLGPGGQSDSVIMLSSMCVATITGRPELLSRS